MIAFVAPLAGAWIEIFAGREQAQRAGSLPSRERGLKSFYLNNLCRIRLVAPLAGAWIEICGCIITVAIHFGRSPRGSVD